MKKQILVTLVLMISVFTTAFAEKNSSSTNCSRKIFVDDQIKKIVVEGSVDVVLFEDNGSAIYMFGNTGTTSVTEKNGVLTVKNTQKTGEKTLVYVPVTDIREIEVNDNAKVSSAGPLISGSLTVYVNGNCNVDLKSTGNVTLVEGESTEMVVEKFKSTKGRDTVRL